jgi:glutamyl-Q tRNA(Asp) synthetase
MSIVTRFAPSPTGYLHLGHAFSALIAWRRAREAGGRFLLRLEDIDPGRCRPDFAAAIEEDLAWLGLDWDGPVRVQSAHLPAYRAVVDNLAGRGLLYPCFCTRADIAREIAAAASAPHTPDGQTSHTPDGEISHAPDGEISHTPDGEISHEPDGEISHAPDGRTSHAPDGTILYPGTCRRLSIDERSARIAAGEAFALRLDMARAVDSVGALTFQDETQGLIACRPLRFGDVVLARKDAPASYHLCVTHDDAVQGVTLVTRGQDLLAVTQVHRLIQALMGWREPDYAHHPLLSGPDGRRFAKRDGARSLRQLRAEGHSPVEVRALIGRMASEQTAQD